MIFWQTLRVTMTPTQVGAGLDWRMATEKQLNSHSERCNLPPKTQES